MKYFAFICTMIFSHMVLAGDRNSDMEELNRTLRSCGKFQSLLPLWKTQYNYVKFFKDEVLEISNTNSTERNSEVHTQTESRYINLKEVEGISGYSYQEPYVLLKLHCVVGTQCAMDAAGNKNYETTIDVCTERHAKKAAEILQRMTGAKFQ